MAETAVLFAVERLTDILDQIEFYSDVGKEVQRLQDEFRRMQCFLRDADSKQQEDERVRNWVSDIRNVAYDTEDVIDIFVLNIDPLKRRSAFKRLASCHKEWKLRWNVANDLKAIRLKIQDIAASHETYGIRNIGDGASSTSETLRKLRRSSPRGEERDIVGLDDNTAELVAQLVHTGDRWRAISIVGMGGIGKTTLARKIFNHGDVRARFTSRAWIYVSQQLNARDILQSIIRQIASTRERLETLTDEELEELLYKNLQRKRYLVVLDDIWNPKDWASLSGAFPDRSNGSRLLLTTRNRIVAQNADPQTVPFDLKFLDRESSWELFCKKAFVDGSDTNCSPVLKEIGKEIMERCNGLPLAIIVVGGMLSRKKKPVEWARVLNNMYSHFARDPTGVAAILALSYNDLPFYLKSCFLYLGHFPEDYSIPAHKLFRLWVAEGLIPHQGERMEDIAEDFLNELIERNLVQVARTSVNERVKHCQLHDLLRQLAISKAKEENFLDIPATEEFASSGRPRRLPIYSNSHTNSLKHCSSHLRSLLFFKVVNRIQYKFFKLGRNKKDFFELSDIQFNYISQSFKLLRIMDLEGISCSSIPSTIGALIHLKYLGLRQTNIQVLPQTIGSLRNLQILDVAGNHHLRLVPNIIFTMKNLRHLYIPGKKQCSFLKIDTLKNLQTLSEIHVDGWKRNNPSNLSSLRKLGLRGNFSSDSNHIFNSIEVLLQLQSLKLRAEGAKFPPLANLASLYCLVKLHLAGEITKLPCWLEFPPNLSQITLEYTRLNQDSIEILEKLPKLCILRLKALSYSKEKVKISAEGFPLLEVLELVSLECLEELNLTESSFPRLKIFRIVNCQMLRVLPVEMRHLTSLNELSIEEMPKVFVDRLRCEDFAKIQHIPSVTFA